MQYNYAKELSEDSQKRKLKDKMSQETTEGG